MSNETVTQNSVEDPDKVLKPYSTPTLTNLGSVSVIVQSGAGNGYDSIGGS